MQTNQSDPYEELVSAYIDSTDNRPDSARLLERIIDHEERMTRKQLAGHWGISTRCIGYMISGQIHVSIERWSTLFNLTEDERILRMLIPSEGFALYALPPVHVNDQKTSQVMKHLSGLHAQHSSYMERVLEILKDFRVDGNDGELVQELKHQLPEYIGALLASLKHIEFLYDRWYKSLPSSDGANAVAKGTHSNGKAVAR